MVNLVRVAPSAGLDDDAALQAARAQVAMALQQEQQPGPTQLPLAQGGNQVQARYGIGNALADLANKFSAVYAANKATQKYKDLQDQGTAAVTARNQQMIDALAPPTTPGGSTPAPFTLDAVPSPQQSFSAPDLSQPAPAGPTPATPPAPAPDQPVTLNESHLTPPTVNPVHQQIADALAGVDPRVAAQTLSQLLLQKALPAPAKPVEISAGGALFQPGATPGAPYTKVAENPKDEKPVSGQLRTKIEGDMAQDEIFHPDTGQIEPVGQPYKHKEPPAAVVMMNDPTVQAGIHSDAKLVASGRMAMPPSGGFGPSAMRNAQVRQEAQQLNPNLDATLFNKRQAAERSFAASTDGRNLDSYNTIAQHLDFGQKAYAALQNGDLPAINSIANTLGIQAGQSAPAVYRNIMTFLGNETARATIGGTNGEADRQTLSKMFTDAANPETAASNFNAAGTLIGGRVMASRRRFQSATAVYDTDKGAMAEDPTEFDAKLTPAARAYEKLATTPAGGAGGKTVVRTGTDAKGNRVAQFSDGTIGPAPQ